jgi:putative hemolysin
MIDIESTIAARFPELVEKHPRLIEPTLKLIKTLSHQDEINAFIQTHQHLVGMEFLDKVLEHFDFNYSLSNRSRNRIPTQGRLIITANHPIGSLDGLALLKLVKEVRPDVKVVANELLMQIDPLRPLFIGLDNLSHSRLNKGPFKAIISALEAEQAVIIFPAGEVSRIKPTGIKDGPWKTGFMHFVEKTHAPILPVFIEAKNSPIFYSLSSLFKPLGTLMLVQEMFNKQHQTIHFHMGELISAKGLLKDSATKRDIAKDLRALVYSLAKKKTSKVKALQSRFKTEKTLVHPVDRSQLKEALKAWSLLGQTSDGKQIYLVDYEHDNVILREIGRLRELSFRQVDEGTGQAIDLDVYDRHYQHLVLWDRDDLEIAGAYRIANCQAILDKQGVEGLYCASLFSFEDEFLPCLSQAIELGRSFVQPRYWGRRSLDYLWYGIGAYLKANPQIRYLFGPVSLSHAYPQRAKDLIIGFYQQQFACQSEAPFAVAKRGYHLSREVHDEAESWFGGDYKEALVQLNRELDKLGVKLPTLYKQYTELCEPGGSCFIDFSVDPAFNNCIDGLVLVDLTQVKSAKRARYIGE